MTWKDIGKIIGSAAPVLAGVLTGPAGVAVSAAGALLCDCLGEDPDPAAVAQRLQKDPKALEALKRLEREREHDIMEFRRFQLQAAMDNQADARHREIEMARAKHGAAWTTSLVAVIVTVGFFIMLRFVLDQSQVSQAALLLLGSLGSAFGAVVNYYLGSSIGSQEKNRLLKKP